jgi:hypothetical protein
MLSGLATKVADLAGKKPETVPAAPDLPPKPAEPSDVTMTPSPEPALEKVRPGPRVEQAGYWVVPKVDGGDVDVRKATDTAIRSFKTMFRGSKDVRVYPSALALAGKKGDKPVPFGAAYFEAAPMSSGWLDAKKDEVMKSMWVVPDGGKAVPDMYQSQGMALAFKGGVQGQKGVNYVLQAVKFGVDKGICSAPDVVFLGDTYEWGLWNRDKDMGAAALVIARCSGRIFGLAGAAEGWSDGEHDRVPDGWR